MPTARDIITLAFREAGILGVGQDLLAQDVNDGLTYLKMMMAQWQSRRWMVPALITYNVLGTGAVSYTVGTGGNIDIVRPKQIEAAYVIQENTGANPVSIWLTRINSKEDYDAIALKNQPTLPNYYFYDGSWPLANLYFWPLPSSMYRMYITVRKQLDFPQDSLDTEFVLPEEYLEAIHYNLAIRLISAYDSPLKQTTAKLAVIALNTIKNQNSQISELKMPSTLVVGRAFNIYNPDGY